MEFELYLREHSLKLAWQAVKTMNRVFPGVFVKKTFLTHFIFYQLSRRDVYTLTEEGIAFLREQIKIHSSSTNNDLLDEATEEIASSIRDFIQKIIDFECKHGDTEYYVRYGNGVLYLEHLRKPICQIKLMIPAFSKLRSFYVVREEAWPLASRCFFLNLFKMLYRYETLNLVAKETMQLSMNNKYYDELMKKGVEFECFASPINAHLKKFCSAFYETDEIFGSYGSIFANLAAIMKGKDINLSSNPPYQLHIINEHVKELLELLDFNQKIGKKNNVYMVLPKWDDAEFFSLLKESKFTKKFEFDSKLAFQLIDIGKTHPRTMVPCETLIVELSNE